MRPAICETRASLVPNLPLTSLTPTELGPAPGSIDPYHVSSSGPAEVRGWEQAIHSPRTSFHGPWDPRQVEEKLV